MKIAKTGLIFSVGVLVGFLIRPGWLRAQSGQAHVFIAPVTVNGDQGAPANLPGARIAGISCLPKPLKNAPDMALCYVATTTAN